MIDRPKVAGELSPMRKLYEKAIAESKMTGKNMCPYRDWAPVPLAGDVDIEETVWLDACAKIYTASSESLSTFVPATTPFIVHELAAPVLPAVHARPRGGRKPRKTAVALVGPVPEGSQDISENISLTLARRFAFYLSWYGLVPDDVDEVVCFVHEPGPDSFCEGHLPLSIPEIASKLAAHEDNVFLYDSTGLAEGKPLLSASKLEWTGFPTAGSDNDSLLAPSAAFLPSADIVNPSRFDDIAAAGLAASALVAARALPIAGGISLSSRPGDMTGTLSAFLDAVTLGRTSTEAELLFHPSWLHADPNVVWQNSGWHVQGFGPAALSRFSGENSYMGDAARQSSELVEAARAIDDSEEIWRAAFCGSGLPLLVNFGQMVLRADDAKWNENAFAGMKRMASLASVEAMMDAYWKHSLSLEDVCRGSSGSAEGDVASDLGRMVI